MVPAPGLAGAEPIHIYGIQWLPARHPYELFWTMPTPVYQLDQMMEK